MNAIDSIDAASRFYIDLLRMLHRDGVPVLIGGAYAFAHFTGIRRPTKDLDLFVRQDDWPRMAAIAQQAGLRPNLTYPHWLGKIHGDDGFVDVIFNSGNGVSPVDEAWFEHAIDGQVLGEPVRLVPIEENIWTRAYIMERERFDGADVAHLLHACALRIDWRRLLQRFGEHWRVLMAHLVLFGFIYPGERGLVPVWVMDELAQRLHDETHGEPPHTDRCAGTLLSRAQYLPDVVHHGYADTRLTEHSTMTHEDVACWTAAISTPAAEEPPVPGEPAGRPPAPPP